MDLHKITYSEEFTRKIYQQVLTDSSYLDAGNFTRISVLDLKLIFQLYDKIYFNNFFLKDYKKIIKFDLSDRKIKTGGKVAYNKIRDDYKIVLSSFLIFKSFQDNHRSIKVNGITCKDRLEATMRILEHEIIHLLELLLYGSTSCAKPRFKELSHRIFNHTEQTHQLVTQPEIAHKYYDLRVGDSVSFVFNRKRHCGVINRINKRATVMVKNDTGEWKDSNGMRYSKFYIPLEGLEHAKDDWLNKIVK